MPLKCQIVVSLLVFCAVLSFGQSDPSQSTPGTFLGVIVEPPGNAQKQGVLFLRGRNGAVRAVEVTKAEVDWADELPEGDRLGTPYEALRPGSEIRVTANQSPDGQWHAVRIEVTIRAHIPQVTVESDEAARTPRRTARPSELKLQPRVKPL